MVQPGDIHRTSLFFAMAEVSGDAAVRGASKPAVAPVETVFVRWLVRVALAVGVLAVAAQLAEIPWRSALRGYDDTFNYLWLRSLMIDGDWNFANDVEQADTIEPTDRDYVRGLPRTPTDHVPNKYGIGWAVLTTPAFVAADLVVRIGNGLGVWQLARDGFNPVYQVSIVLWHAFLAIVALLVTRLVLATWLEEPWTTIGVVSVWLASPLLYYQTSNIGMSHGAVVFAVTVALFGLVRGLRDPVPRWPWLLAGGGLALAAITRYQAAVFGLLAVWALVERVRQQGWRGGSTAGWLVLGGAPFLVLQALAWHAVYGRWLVFSYGVENEAFHWGKPAFVGSLLSSFHGLFYWHPLLLIAFAGLGWWAVAATRFRTDVGNRNWRARRRAGRARACVVGMRGGDDLRQCGVVVLVVCRLVWQPRL